MADILTITLNPAIDKTYIVDELVPEHKLRCGNPSVEAGGGGINVSKGLKELGGSSVAVFFAGGRNGDHLREILQHEAIECRSITVAGETRESLIVIDRSSKKEFRIVVEGPSIRDEDFRKIFDVIQTEKPAWIIASGSLPKGLPHETYARLAHYAKQIGSKFILDTSGEALKAGLAEGVYMIKPNLKELSILAGVDMLQADHVPQAAAQLIKDGKAEVVVVSMSSAGAMIVTREGHHYIRPPKVEQRSTVGAGDSMVSGMVWALQKKKTLLETVCWGVACGSAATMHTGSKLFTMGDVEQLFRSISENARI